LNGKVQKHANFQKELGSNKSRIEEIVSTGRGIKTDASEGIVESRLEDILSLWTALEEAALKKESRLSEASQQQQFNRTIEDIEVWLTEVEGSLQSEDYGKDLTSVQNLQKKHQLLESDVAGHSERIEVIRQTADEFIERGHFDKENIAKKSENVVKRYEGLSAPLEQRRKKLTDSLRVQELFRDVEDEEAWIREKEPIVGSNNRGRDLIGVQNLIKKHAAVMSEIVNHEGRINSVLQVGTDLVGGGNFMATEVETRVGRLNEHWDVLKEKAEKRLVDLKDAVLVIYEGATAGWVAGAQVTLRGSVAKAPLPPGHLLPAPQPTVELCPCAAEVSLRSLYNVCEN
jgi:spectrin alpha